MAASQFVNRDVQPLPCHAPLELDWKQAIIASGNHVDRSFWPALEAAGFAEYCLGLIAHMRVALLDDSGGNVVQEICYDVEIGAVAAATSRLCPCSRCPRVLPPFTRRLAGNWDHRVHE